IAVNDVAEVVAVRLAVLEIEVGKAVRQQLRQVATGARNAAEVFDVRARIKRRDDDRLDQLRTAEAGVEWVALRCRIARRAVAEEVRQIEAVIRGEDRRSNARELIEEQLPVSDGMRLSTVVQTFEVQANIIR